MFVNATRSRNTQAFRCWVRGVGTIKDTRDKIWLNGKFEFSV